MMKTLQKKQTEKYLSLLKQGNERGLDYFYRRFYDYLFGRAYRATLDECIAESIAQEALLRLWLYRQQVQDVADILDFLKRQTRAAIDAFYTKHGTASTGACSASTESKIIRNFCWAMKSKKKKK